MKKIITILLILLCNIGFTQNFYSISGDMDWSTVSSWSSTSMGATCICSPPAPTAPADSIFIETNVTLYNSLVLKALSALIIRSGDTLTITGDVTFDNGSYLYIEPGGVLIILGNLTNKNNSDDIIIDGGLDVGGDLTNGAGGIISGTGDIDVGGSIDNKGTIGGSTEDDLGSLPIELIDFNAIVYGKHIDLIWSTATELNNLYFIIERSSSAVVFEDIGTIMGAGNSSELLNYSFVDTLPLNGLSYYRLTQVDYDGSMSSSNIISLARTDEMDSTLKFKVYPNPSTGDVIKIESIKNYLAEQEILVVVLDMKGRTFYSKIILTTLSGKFVKAIDLHGVIPNGVYIVMGSSNNDMYSQMLIIE